MTVTIGITCYNRKSILEKMASSLRRSRIPINISIRVYDDCSTEYGIDYLKVLFPDAKTIIHNDKNYGPDWNTWTMYKDFLKSEDEYFFNADSDILFDPSWLEFSLRNIEKTDGILSLFNTKTHVTLQNIDEDLCIKKDLGAAGTFFKRIKVKELLGVIEDGSKHIDWQWSDYFTSQGTRLFCSSRSFVQHIGILGYNSIGGFIDFGEKFVICNVEDGQVINDVFEKFIDTSKIACNEKVEKIKRSTTYRVGEFIIKPATIVRKLLKKGK